MKIIVFIVVIVVIYFLYVVVDKYLNYRQCNSNSKDKNILLLYFVPWCGYCRKLTPIWKKIQKKLKGRVTCISINCEKSPDLCKRDGVTGYPTIRLVTKDGKVIDYDGDRSESDLSNFALL